MEAPRSCNSGVHTVEFQLSALAVELTERMTNREPPWIRVDFAAYLHADGSGGYVHAGSPAFPTYDVYLGDGGSEMFKIGHTDQESVLVFIDRGHKKNEKGL